MSILVQNVWRDTTTNRQKNGCQTKVINGCAQQMSSPNSERAIFSSVKFLPSIDLPRIEARIRFLNRTWSRRGNLCSPAYPLNYTCNYHCCDCDCDCHCHCHSYLIFVISFTQAAFFNSKFYTRKLTKNIEECP